MMEINKKDSKPLVSQKILREINNTSVFYEILRRAFEYKYNGNLIFFVNDAPDEWQKAEKEAFDLVTAVDACHRAFLSAEGFFFTFFSSKPLDSKTSCKKKNLWYYLFESWRRLDADVFYLVNC